MNGSGHPAGHPLRGARDQGWRGPGPADRSDRLPRTDRRVACPHRSSAAGCATALPRGAALFLAHGSLTEPGRSMALEVTCPGPEAALALVGRGPPAGHRAKAREVRNVDRVVIRDGDAHRRIAHPARCARVAAGLGGAADASRGHAPRRTGLANFDDANLRRSARGRRSPPGARVERALEILGDDVPDHLRAAGVLRIENKQAKPGRARPAA